MVVCVADAVADTQWERASKGKIAFKPADYHYHVAAYLDRVKRNLSKHFSLILMFLITLLVNEVRVGGAWVVSELGSSNLLAYGAPEALRSIQLQVRRSRHGHPALAEGE